MAKNYYKSGEFNLICDVCGKKIKAHESKHRWDGLVVCFEDYEQRHPQDFVRARQDKISIPFNRPRPTDIYVELVCTSSGRQGLADYGQADCCTVGVDYGLRDYPNVWEGK